MSTTNITASLHTAVLSAFQAAAELVPGPLRPQFVLVGGAALLHHGAKRATEDIDVVSSASAHWEFLEAARLDARFSVLLDGAFIQYTAPSGLVIRVDLIELGGEACPQLVDEPLKCGEGFVASLRELWRMKARAHAVTRVEDGGKVGRDYSDFVWIGARMVELGVDYDPVELTDMLVGELRERR